MSSIFSSSSTNSRNFWGADDVYVLGVVGVKVAEHQPQSSSDGLFGKNFAFAV